MNQPQPQIYCPNPTCVAPLNAIGRSTCAACHTPLIYRYLWAVGNRAATIATGTQLSGRYYVTAPHIWLDTQPSLPPDVPTEWSDEVQPYLHLYPQRLHVPEVYGFWAADEATEPLILLENVPLDAAGLLAPAIVQVWEQATAVRQVYWLWQMLQLWTPLHDQGVAASLMAVSNLRVEGWRVRLCQLYQDMELLLETGQEDPPELGLADLANLWLSWLDTARPAIQSPLQDICHQMQTKADVATIATHLNHLLLSQASQLPLHLQIASATDTGPERSHNEDACYPPAEGTPDPDLTTLAIVCDGIGGHEGGEVASQLAVQTLKLQAQALLAEVAQQPELVSPELLAHQLEASVRVANNLIAAQNDEQGREERRRMGTTLVLALQVPQQAANLTVAANGHELYLVHVGDSRAYWITPRYCQCLTVDDDVAAREVRLGRSLYREALQRPDAGALTQAIGTRDAEFLRPTVQRFILEEDGLLLLCSDGLSDNNLVEQSWVDQTDAVLRGKQSLAAAAQAWVELANQKNGYDNTSVVLLRCLVSETPPEVTLPNMGTPESDWSPSAQALLDEDPAVAANPPIEPQPVQSRRSKWLLLLLGLLAIGLLGGFIGLAILKEVAPHQSQPPGRELPR